MSAKKSRTTHNQLEAMVNYLEQNKELLLYKGSKKKLEKWTELSIILNSMGRGPIKSTKEWKRVLIEWKYNTKMKLKTKGNVKRLSDAEEKLIKLLGEVPNEDVDLSEIQFIEVLVEDNPNENIETVKTELDEKDIKEEIQESGTDYLSSTSNNCAPILQNEDIKPATEIASDPVVNYLDTNSRKKSVKIKRRKFHRTNVFRRNVAYNRKSSKLLVEAMLKLAESNLKLAASNCKIAESNEMIAKALNMCTQRFNK